MELIAVNGLDFLLFFLFLKFYFCVQICYNDIHIHIFIDIEILLHTPFYNLLFDDIISFSIILLSGDSVIVYIAKWSSQ